MRVFYDYQIFLNQKYGGVSRYFVELVRHLSAHNELEINIVAPLHINRYLNSLKSDVVTGRLVSNFPKAAEKALVLYNRLASQYWLKKYEPDIVHETYFTTYPLAVNEKQISVVTVYDMVHELFPQYFKKRDRTSLRKRQAVERAAHIICISDRTRKDLLDITGISNDKVSVVHLGFDSSLPAIDHSNTLVDENYILYVGERGRYKNFLRLLNAYSRSPTLYKNFKLVCFGGGKFNSIEDRQRAALGLSDERLQWVGGDDAVLSQLYNDATVFVYPSLYEGFGLPPLEAMSCACPVVCSKGGSIPEVVGQAGEFFDPYDESDIANSIERVVTSPQRADTLRNLGRERITKFTWQKCASETYSIYNSLK